MSPRNTIRAQLDTAWHASYEALEAVQHHRRRATRPDWHALLEVTQGRLKWVIRELEALEADMDKEA